MEDSEIKKLIMENAEVFEKFQRINNAVEEEMEQIQKRKQEHPELYETDVQLAITNKFIEENPDLNYVEIKKKGDR